MPLPSCSDSSSMYEEDVRAVRNPILLGGGGDACGNGHG